MLHKRALSILALITLAACSSGGFGQSNDPFFAPGVAGESDIDGLLVGHRLMAAGEYELALKAYTRAAAQQGLNVDTLSALGSANLRLGRLGQAERLLRRATDDDPNFPAAWNNLGVILMEKGNYAEAAEVFRRAFATDNGNSDQIKENLRISLALVADPFYDDPQNEDVKLVRRGSGDYVILTAL
ncbi:MAG: tetratricopeptide repeat protein [Yoonia sp.]|nr:tetratricopeptide repeat protein [Yoonia sp.]MDG1864376.1 tetratricopeptide repeat protein [Yoonia sp.]